MIRHSWIDAHADLTQKRQCALAGVSRSTVYAKRRAVVGIPVDRDRSFRFVVTGDSGSS